MASSENDMPILFLEAIWAAIKTILGAFWEIIKLMLNQFFKGF